MDPLKLPVVSLGAFRIECCEVQIHEHTHVLAGSIQDGLDTMVEIRVVMRVPDVRDPTHMINTAFTQTLTRDIWEGFLERRDITEVLSMNRAMIRDHIVHALAHEVDEWLSVNGVRLDPHHDDEPKK